MNSLEELNNYGVNNGITFTDDRPYAASFSGTTTAENIAANEDILFALDAINDFNFDVLRSIDDANENHIILEFDFSNSEDLAAINNRYEGSFPAAPRNVEYKQYVLQTNGIPVDYRDLDRTQDANVFVATKIQTNSDFRNIYRSFALAAIDRTAPLTGIARILFPPTGNKPVSITNNNVAIDFNTYTINSTS